MAPLPDPHSTQAGEHGPTARPLLHPGWGAWRGAQHALLWETFCNLIALQFKRHPPMGYEI